MYVCIWGGFLIEYSFDVCWDQADYWWNIHSVYAGITDYQPNIYSGYEWIRWIANQIFSWCMQGSGGLLTKYSFDVWMGQADCWPNIHLVYARVRQITNWIFNSRNNRIKQVKIEYSIVGMIRMIRLGRLELNI